ncbi:MAG: ATP synthase F1 subunit delta [Bacteroidales bacterium]|nr:ATP synthase F1 subunit delta [Bacteroidales bacterium]
MNSEVISSRYAKALLTYAAEAGSGDKVYSQALAIVQVMQELPQLMDIILRRDDVTLSKKTELLSLAIGEPLTAELIRFMELVISQRRMDKFHSMLLSFVVKFREANNIKVGSLVTAAPDENLKERLENMFSNRTNSKVYLSATVDPEVLGGFVFELDGYRLDASVRTRLEKIRQCLVDDNNRIV